MRTLALSIVLFLIPFSLYASGRSDSAGLAARVAELEAQVAAMEEVLQYVHVETGEINALAGPHWIIEGVNVHVRSGSGWSNDGCNTRDPNYPNCENLTGLGNLIVGYNEQRNSGANFPREIRTGSHNLVVGDYHTYSSFGGFVAGGGNQVTGRSASVCGGSGNVSSGLTSSISGGQANVASGANSSVSGGHSREAPDDFNWAAGNLFEPN